MGAAENKAMVVEFFRRGMTSDAAAGLLASDFRAWVPKGLAPLLADGHKSLAGAAGLKKMETVDEAVYRDGVVNSSVVYIVADGDWVVLCFDVTATTHDGDDCANRYVFSVHCQDGKITEMWELTDTKHWMDVVAATTQQRAAIRTRLRGGRSAV